MAILNTEVFVDLVKREFKILPKNYQAHKERRLQAYNYADKTLKYIQQDFQSVNTLFDENKISEKDLVLSFTELALELTSFLYAVGADHGIWKKWSALSGIGLFLQEKIYESIEYLILGEEWNFIDRLSKSFSSLHIIQNSTLYEGVISTLALSQDCMDFHASGEDVEEKAWLSLIDSIPSQKYDLTRDCLVEIAEFWMMEDEDNWMQFHPRSYPDFETPVCAVAALACHQGFPPKGFTTEQYQFLEPGLVSARLETWFPQYFELPLAR
ncbi:hypothetical protein [Baaleninema sp.]|uniref:hypothetical protein n=1 Tax=Baaleninema sp. TaxID=3101197 RepID=UPI003D008E03